MEEIIKTIHIEKLSEQELSAEERRLLDAARSATYRSYAPYSKFSVGAAVLLADGEILSGNNQENCAFPSGLCAERTTLFYANSLHPDTPVRMLCIAARDSSGQFTTTPISPCGACRQVMLETEHRFATSIRILLYGTDAIYVLSSARDLLPVAFDSDNLI